MSNETGRVDQNLAQEIVNQLHETELKLKSIDERVLVGLDLKDLLEEVEYGQKILSDRSNLI